ncbi:MAG: phosphoribosylanthranilate isomerase [Desulfuromonadales bacterium]|nr:phosphoribosylanthranilate isomerase [Desulfuromonadales bacterium]
MVKVKICGITTVEDAIEAAKAEADALGFVFYEKSSRYILPIKAASIIRELPPFIQTVGLFVNEEPEKINWTADFCGLDIVQLHGDETPDDCMEVNRRVIKAFRVKDDSSFKNIARYNIAGYLLDACVEGEYGGTGEKFNWSLAAQATKDYPVILAGGLTPENVAEAIKAVKPYAVDVSSGVESAPGRKDIEKVRSFIKNVKNLAT